MTAVPKPKKVHKSSDAPKLTEEDFEEIGEKINEALEFSNEVEITTYHQKQFDSAKGVVTNADGQTGKLTMRVGYEEIKININSIVSIK
ncbi:YolD-like family protein [Sporosarcina sp. FSL K6-2383]|uniref:YolD-like family protein n=1 Tax=Sporosarcina sp. FSL K6-2383 TaxID=2921556 RepID=UPI00315B27A5